MSSAIAINRLALLLATVTICNIFLFLISLYLIVPRDCQELFEHSASLRAQMSYNPDPCQFIKPYAKLDHVNYHPVYERFLCRFKNDRFTMIEIGTGGYSWSGSGGEGMSMFGEYFPNAHVVSVDIIEKNIKAPPRTTLLQGDQGDQKLLARLCKDYENIEIIIDDGSHQSADIIFTFEHLWPCLKTGGIYVIEDTQTSYWPHHWGGSCDLEQKNTSMNYFKRLADEQNYKEILLKHPHFTSHQFAHEILGLHFYHNLILLEKGDNTLESNAWGIVEDFVIEKCKDPNRKEPVERDP